jgi:hypothetical protein
MSTNRFCLPISRLFSCAVNIAFKVPYEIVIKFYMSNDSFKYYYCLYIWYRTVFSSKLATATGHAMLINLQCIINLQSILWLSTKNGDPLLPIHYCRSVKNASRNLKSKKMGSPNSFLKKTRKTAIFSAI